MADTTRLELATSAVTGQRSNQLSYASILNVIIAYLAIKIKGYMPGILKVAGLEAWGA